MLQLLWNSLAYFGVAYAENTSEEKHIILINVLVLMIIPINLINSTIGYVLHYPPVFALTTIVYSALLLLVMVFNAMGKLALARFFFGLTSFIFIAFFTLMIGNGAQFQLFFLLGLFVSFFIFPAREKFSMYLFSLCFAAAYIYFDLFNDFGGYLKLNPTSALERRVLTISSVTLLIFSFAAYVKNSFIVAERAIEIEKEKSEKLLHNILPAAVVKKLRERHETIAETLDQCTVLFSDLVGFSSLTRTLPAVEIVSLLNEIFCDFDDLAEKYNLEKIKTIGDAYMLVGGLQGSPQVGAEQVASFALEMLTVIEKFRVERDLPLHVRIGINTGDAVAGVIGKKKFTYDLWGDSVNTASRMESHGLPGQIQVTHSTYSLLKDKFTLSDRGEIEVKGLGLIKSYMLTEATP